MSGHAAVFSVRCSKFVDIVSNNRSSLSAQHQVSINTSYLVTQYTWTTCKNTSIVSFYKLLCTAGSGDSQPELCVQ